jgi:uncharacterized protein YbjT (DUF2867 family)
MTKRYICFHFLNNLRMKTAFVVGATGLVGQKLVEKLCQHPAYGQVVLWGRRHSPFRDAKIVDKIGTFEQLSVQDFTGVDEVFCCLGTTIKKAGSQSAFYEVDCLYPYQVGYLAKEAGVSQLLIVTALGADAQSGIFYNRVKGEVEEKIQALSFESLHIFRPSLLLGDRQEQRAGERWAQKLSPLFAWMLVGRPIEADKVAQAMVTEAQKKVAGVQIHESDRIAASV